MKQRTNREAWGSAVVLAVGVLGGSGHQGHLTITGCGRSQGMRPAPTGLVDALERTVPSDLQPGL